MIPYQPDLYSANLLQFLIYEGCSFCSMKFDSISDNLTHMAIAHSKEALLPYMQKKGKWRFRLAFTFNVYL